MLHHVDQGHVAGALRATEEVVVDAAARVEHRVIHLVLARASGPVVERHGNDGLTVGRVGDTQSRQAPEACPVGGVPVDGLFALRSRASSRAEARAQRLGQARGDAVVVGIGLHAAAGVDVATEARDVIVTVVDRDGPVRARAREVVGTREQAACRRLPLSMETSIGARLVAEHSAGAVAQRVAVLRAGGLRVPREFAACAAERVV